MQDIVTSRYGLGTVISTGWRLYWKNFLSILAVYLVVYTPIHIVLRIIDIERLIESLEPANVILFLYITMTVESLFGIIATMALAVLIESSLEGRPAGWRNALGRSLSRWGHYLITAVLAGIIVILMSLLLVVPGIIWYFYYIFISFVVVLRGLSGKEALDYSKALVKGRWWRVLGYFMAITLLGFTALIITGIPFAFLPESGIIQVLSDILSDLVFSIFTCMLVVFFLNIDCLQNRMKRSAEDTVTPVEATRETEPDAATGRSPWARSGLNALIAAALVVTLGLIITILTKPPDPESFGEAIGASIVPIAAIVYFFSVLWLKKKRILALTLLGALAVLVSLIIAGDDSETGRSAFRAAAKKGMVTLKSDSCTAIRHEGLGIEITVPDTYLEQVTPPEPGPDMYLWSFANPIAGSVYSVGATYIKMHSRSDLEDFMNGAIESAGDHAEINGNEFRVISRVVSGESMTAFARCRIGERALTIRAMYIESRKPGYHVLVSANVINQDRAQAWAAVYSLSASDPSEWNTSAEGDLK